ncbi:MHYT domain-containing protein [Roseibium sp.]|uniref:MHYT domain-containing protein n=1 Tax=Roseibium sp. TaxID=1936156 RepID=UPI003D12585F
MKQPSTYGRLEREGLSWEEAERVPASKGREPHRSAPLTATKDFKDNRVARVLCVISCISNEHDPLFLVLAAVVCIGGSVATMRLFDRACRFSINRKSTWILMAGIVSGSSIWATHFVSMPGFRPLVAFGYEPVLTIVSLLLSVLFTLVGLNIAASPLPRRGYGNSQPGCWRVSLPPSSNPTGRCPSVAVSASVFSRKMPGLPTI